jgi:hypothetical protein
MKVGVGGEGEASTRPRIYLEQSDRASPLE